jgi:hypothetical protein
MQPEGLEHLAGTAEADYWTLLLNRERGEENGHNPVLAERNTVAWMSGHL